MGPLPGSDFGALPVRLALSLDRKPTSSLHHTHLFTLKHLSCLQQLVSLPDAL